MITRSPKPRDIGFTIVLDKGLSVRSVEDMIDIGGDHIDLVKLGWGTALVTKNLRRKIDAYQHADIPVFFGGTLFEYFLIQNDLKGYKGLLDEHQLDFVEISDGTVDIPHEQKLNYIQEFSKNYKVLSEVGSKDETVTIPPYKWLELMQSELDAGSSYVITEARESGRGGICRPSGELRYGLIDEIVTKIPPEKIIFEAPNKGLQVWFIKRFGNAVNLANIPPDEVIPLETLRRGLRSDTLLYFHGKSD